MAACKKDTSPDIPRSQDGRSVILVVAIDCTKSRALAVALGTTRAPWVLTDKSIALTERGLTRVDSDLSDGTRSFKTRGELRNLDHLRRQDGETVMDHVFGEETSTKQVYEQAFRNIVFGAAEGMNGAILAYGQTASGKTFSISGATAVAEAQSDEDPNKGIIHFALEDLFGQLTAKASGHQGIEYLVRMSYCELYMERVNDLLRKIGPQSQNLAVKEDPEGRCFYADGLKEKIVSSAEEVLMLFAEAEKRRRVAHTRYNEVSSRSHTLLTLCVECSVPLEDGEDDAGAQSVTRVGRLVIVDLAGNERLEAWQAGTEYVAESSSINKSLFFLGKVIEKLAARDKEEGEHIPFRDSKLTRLLSVHLNGNSQTGLLVTLTPSEDAIEQSLTTLRFAQKAAEVRCVAKPVLISKEQSLIEDLAAEREQCAQQLQALVLSSERGSGQSFISKSREVDTVVTALHHNMDVLKKQKAMVVESMKGLYATIHSITGAVSEATDIINTSGDCEAAKDTLRRACAFCTDGSGGGAAWSPAILQLQEKLELLDWNAMRYAQLQEEMQQAEQDLAAIEQEEMAALSRLQRSQSVRESVVSQYQVAPSHPAMGDITATSMRTDTLEEPPKQLVNERIEEVTELAEVTEVEVPRDDLKDTLDTDQRAAPRSHQSSGSHGFGPLDSEPEETVSQEPKQQCDETLVAPDETAGDETQPKKREGVRPKQPRGYGFSPKKRAAAAAAGAWSRQ
eukprot:symbB.v1.2.028385.t1/scaffold2960.1/size66438/3